MCVQISDIQRDLGCHEQLADVAVVILCASRCVWTGASASRFESDVSVCAYVLKRRHCNAIPSLTTRTPLLSHRRALPSLLANGGAAS